MLETLAQLTSKMSDKEHRTSAAIAVASVSAFSSSIEMREFCEPSEPARERRR